jgi:hypothetical protein
MSVINRIKLITEHVFRDRAISPVLLSTRRKPKLAPDPTRGHTPRVAHWTALFRRQSAAVE